MSWRDLLQTNDTETVVFPWVGGRSLQAHDHRGWLIEGRLPPEHGWYEFEVLVRKALRWKPVETPWGVLKDVLTGYLVGDRFIPEEATRVEANLAKLVEDFERVHLIEMGLDRFVRVSVGRAFEDGPLIYQGQEMPLGAEPDVLEAFLAEARNINKVLGVPPALDAAFRIETWRRKEAEKRHRKEQERREKEERRQQLIEQLGDGAGRRAMAAENFGEAARAALAVGEAHYLDHRQGTRQGEMVVRFRLMDRRFECTCDSKTLRIIEAGVCLTDESTGERGDELFTLESLPGVIQQADEEGVLVVFRHVN